MPLPLRDRFFESTRGRIVGVLRRQRSTVDELAGALGLSPNAIRVQLSGMERDGLVRHGGTRAGVTRPSHVFELTPEVELLLSRAYIPLLSSLVRVMSERRPAGELDALMRAAGEGLVDELPGRLPEGSPPERAAAASRLLNSELGALTEAAEVDGHSVIRGDGCPLAALTGKHPAVCHAVESMLARLLPGTVRECCDREGRPRCCFEILPSPPEPRTAREAPA